MRGYYTLLYMLAWPFFHLTHPARVVGRERLPAGAALACANHTSLSDPLYIVYAFRLAAPLRIIAKDEVLHWPVVGWLLKKAGIFGVKRGKSDIGAVKEALRILNGGGKLLVFPEGTRHKTGELGEARTGAAMFALRTGVPVVPVWVPPQKAWFRPIRITIGEPYCPVQPAGKPTQEDYRIAAEDIMAHVAALKGAEEP